jgi:CubicO group peptidase (beta-lactamase class C family)
MAAYCPFISNAPDAAPTSWSIEDAMNTAAAALPGHGPIPHDEWDRAPWNRRTFQRVRELVPTAQVRRSANPHAWKLAPQDIGTVQFELDGRSSSVAAFLESSYTDGFCVVHRGALVAEQYYNGMNAHSLHLVQSVSKSVTATALGIFAGRGELQLDALVTHYLPELLATAYRGATIQQVLDMTSGVYWDEDYTAPDSHCAKMDVAAGWKTRRDPDWPACMWELVLTLQQARGPHGQDFSYRSIETDVLGFVLERVAGMPLAELVSRELWMPMGAAEDACYTVDPAGFACACGGFNATLRDLARFGLLYATDGEARGGGLVPPEWLRQTRNGNPDLFRGAYREVLPRGAYRNQFWLEEAGRRVLLARGVFGQLIYMDPDAGFVAVKVSSWPEFVNPARTRTALAAMRAIRAALQ